MAVRKSLAAYWGKLRFNQTTVRYFCCHSSMSDVKLDFCLTEATCRLLSRCFREAFCEIRLQNRFHFFFSCTAVSLSLALKFLNSTTFLNWKKTSSLNKGGTSKSKYQRRHWAIISKHWPFRLCLNGLVYDILLRKIGCNYQNLQLSWRQTAYLPSQQEIPMNKLPHF